VTNPVPTEVNGNLSKTSKCVLGHVFLKSEPDPFAKMTTYFFSFLKKPKDKGLKTVPMSFAN